MKLWVRKTITHVTALAFINASVMPALALPIAALRAPEAPAVQTAGPSPTPTADYRLAFDGRADTAFASAEKTVIEYPLAGRQSLQGLRFLDGAPFVLTADYWDGRTWKQVPEWNGLNLSEKGTGWQGVELSRAIDTERLRLTLEPRASAHPGLKELEFWTASGADAVVTGVAATSQAIGVATNLPGQFRSYPASLGEGWIGTWPEQPSDNPADNQFTVTLDVAPTAIKRAWLVYELYGVQDHAAVSRSINDQLAVGGYLIQKGTAWTLQKEALNPAWLRAGSNRVLFTLPEQAPYGYRVRNLRVVIESHTGTQLLAALRTSGPAALQAAQLFDGKTSTAIALNQFQGAAVTPAAAPVAAVSAPALRSGGLGGLIDRLSTGQGPASDSLQDGRPYAGQGAATGKPQAQADSAWTRTRHADSELLPGCQDSHCQETLPEGTVEATLEDWTALEQLSLHAAGTGLANVELKALTATGWVAVGSSQRVAAGWNTIPFAGQPPVKAVRLTFDRLPAQISLGELRVQGHTVRGTVARDLVLSSPVAGRYYSDKAYLKGYVSGDGTDAVQLMVGSQKVPARNGEFEVLVRKPAGSGSSWSVNVAAIFSDGQVIRQRVNLTTVQTPDFERALAPAGTTTGAPVTGVPQVVAGDDASLEIDKDAIKGKVLTITPLRDVDLPALDAGLVNVTRTHKGYRFLPHGRFAKKIKVRMGYDKTKLPPGYTEADIQTFFFDEATGRWVPLETADIDVAKGEVVALTDHFTDMINGVLQVPDNPETQSYTPTQLKDIKAADPGAGINLIEVPEATAMGDANLGYPIHLPPGRLGVQPSLRLGYSSGAANGWLGQGWNLSLPAVTIDTRWGVPRYSATHETETYTLAGEQLTPLAHREELKPRTAEKTFHARVEGAFQRIVRHGDSPKNYWWEVTAKDGTRFTYGGLNGQLAAGAVLTDGEGNVAHWALTEQRDTNGNFVRYHYAKVQDAGVGNGQGGVPGYQLYIQRITYTGAGNAEGAYSVDFQRDRDLGEARRADVSIDARLGFKQVTADLLRKIQVKYKSQAVRSYELVYQKGAFNKTLLKEVRQFGADGSLFNKHEFDYFDDARKANGEYKGFASTTDWEAGADTVSVGLLGKGIASVLGGSKSTTTGGHFYAGAGPIGNPMSKTSTAGFKVGYSRGNSEGLVALTDINGDGLPDKVFKGSGGFVYRPNLSGPTGQSKFGTAIPLANLPGISREKVTSTTIGGESYFGVPVLHDRNRAITESDTYLNDVNADGITDVVRGGTVLFGYVSSSGAIAYSANSNNTPVPIGQGNIDTTALLENAAEVEAERAASFPLLDTITRWVAPYDGVVSVNAPVQLVQDTTAARAEYDGADGVRVAVQLEDAELWATTIEPTDYSAKIPTGLSSIPVRKGDRLYFRIQSVFDGAYDQVNWDPEVTYLNVSSERKDVNGLSVYKYKASTDFTLAGRRSSVTMPVNGTLHLGGLWKKTGITTDDVTLLIAKNGTEIYRHTLRYDQVTDVTISQDIQVAQLDELEWRILTDSPVNVGKVSLLPEAYYTSAENVDSVKDEEGNYVLQAYPSYDMDLYVANDLEAPHDFYTVTTSGNLPVRGKFQLSGLSSGQTMEAVFTVKKPGGLLSKHALTFIGDSDSALPAEVVVAASVPVVAGDKIFFDISTRDRSLPAKLSLVEVSVGSVAMPAAVPVAVHTPAEESLFPQPYRGWGVAGYNGNSPRDNAPIAQQLLTLNSSYDPNNARVYPFASRPLMGLWGGVDELAWIKAGSSSSSRLGLDDIRMPTSARFAGAAAPTRISRSINNSTSLGISASSGNSNSLVEFQDLNGDRFPDVIGHGGVQYTRPVGGLSGSTTPGVIGSARSSRNETYGVSTSSAGTVAQAIAMARGMVAPSGNKPAPSSSQGSDMPPLGVGGDASYGSSDSEYELIDINGDGLSDKVFENGTASLNLGYRFAAAEPWNAGVINNGESLNAGVNLGFNLWFHSVAGGLNLGTGISRSDESYVDVNGDGLPDKIVAGNVLAVRLNTGSGYTSAMPWPGGHGKVAEDKHISLGGGIYFTYGFNVPLPPIRFVFNPGINHSTSMGRPEVAFQDMDGDGYTDHLFSEKTSALKVAFNPIGRTNLLKKVSRPLGASFTLDYERVGNTYAMPQSRWVMSKVEVLDGVAGDGADRQLMTFKYQDGNYDRRERDFYGFKTVIAESRDTQAGDAVYRRVTRTFANDNYYEKGLLLTEKLTDAAGKPFTQTVNTYALKDVATGALLTTAVQKRSVTATAFPELTETVKTFFEGGAQSKSTRMAYEYDALGNVTKYADFGDTGAGDDLIATITYHALTGPYVMSEPQSIVVKNATGEVLRRRESTLNAQGDLTELRRYLANGTPVTHNFTYDAYGNVKTVQRPANASGQRYTLTYTYDADVNTHVAKVEDSFGYSSTAQHDLRWGAVTESRDLNNQPIRSTFDPFGRLETITGPFEAGQGSKVTLRFAYHPEAAIPWALTQHHDEGRNDPLETVLFTDGLKRVLQTKKDGAVDATGAGTGSDVMIVSGRVFFDAFGRTVAQYHPVTEGLGQQGIFNSTLDSVAPTRTEFDVLDRELKTTLPDNSEFRTVYDFGNDRDGVLQFRTTAIDANEVKKERFTDVRGRQTALKEFNATGNQPTLWTSYRYNALNELVAVKDDRGHLTTAEYDLLGRRTALQSPDAGREERVFDAASNLVQRITSNLREKGVAIHYDYDFERLAATRYPLYPDNNISYTYGAPGAPFHRAGRLEKVSDASGVEEFFYGPLGETVKTTRTVISLTGKGAKTYTTQFRYDTWNRLRELTYPDGEVLTYAYNAGGLLQSINGKKGGDTYAYLNALTYDRFEQRVFQAFGNGTTMRYAYEPERRRLSELKSTNAQRTFMDMRYGYDRMTNILALKNVAPVGVQPDGFGGPTTQSFTYDDLYRLTEARGHWTNVQGHQERYELDLQYDTLHNLTQKTQTHERLPSGQGNWLRERKTSYDWAYTYGSAKPHAATQIGERTFGFDANGNQLGWTQGGNGQRRGLVWDEENRLRSLSDNGRTQTYVYDANGERVIKRGRQGETAYINSYFVIRNGAVASKHVFNGSQRIATKLVKQESTTIPGGNGSGENNGVGNGNVPPGWIRHGKTSNPGANFPSAQDRAQQVATATAYDPAQHGGTVYEHQQYFYHPDHVGSTGYVTDANGAVYEHLEYFAFGETWVQERSNIERTPYLFTGKELDEETQLYYFGARYYDPRTSQWQSPDPILNDYFNGRVNGVYEPTNLALYSYARNNPVVLWDADGNVVPLIIGAVVLADKAIAVYDTYQTAKSVASGQTSLEDLAKNKAGDMLARKAVPGGSIVGKVIDKVKDSRSVKNAVETTTKKGPYRGGAHADTKQPVGDGLDSHHMPADSVSPISREKGPAIQMEPADHRETSSHGSKGAVAAEYRAKIGAMIDEGKMRKAMATEIRDVRRAAKEVSGDRRKYNEAVKEMLDYAKSQGMLDKQ